MVKLMNDSGGCAWVYGTKSIAYKQKAMAVSGLKRMCPRLQVIMGAMALQALESTLLAGYNILYSVENGQDVNRQDVIINIKLPACISEAINTVKKYSFDF